MSKEKKIHTQDRTLDKPATPPAPAPEPVVDPVEEATSVSTAPSVQAILDKLDPVERAVVLEAMKKKAKANAGSTLQATFDAALKKVEEGMAEFHKTVLGFGFPADMPFQLSVGTGLDGKPFVTGKRLRTRESKPKDAAPADAPAPDAPAADAPAQG